jgi:hypothetical protein
MSEKVKGQIAKIQTTADQCVRVIVDIPNEVAPVDIIRWLYATVELTKVGGVSDGPEVQANKIT